MMELNNYGLSGVCPCFDAWASVRTKLKTADQKLM